MSRLSKLPFLSVVLLSALIVGMVGSAALAQTLWSKPGDSVLTLADADAALGTWLDTGDKVAASYDPADLSEANDRIWLTLGQMADDLMSVELSSGTDGANGAPGADGAVGPSGPAGADGLDADPAVTDALDVRITALEADLATHEANVSNPHSVTKDHVGLGNVANTKMNLTATANPTPFDDSAGGYSVGSVWINTATGSVFVLADASVGAASWREVTNDTQTLICDFFLFETITVDTTVYVPSLCEEGSLRLADGMFIGQRRTVNTAGPGDIFFGIYVSPLTQSGGQEYSFRSTGETAMWEWGASGWTRIFP